MANAGLQHKRDLELLAKLRPLDDDFMRCLFRDNLSLAQDVLRTLTGIGDLVLVEEEVQRDLRRVGGGRSVVLDVWGRDSAGRWYDLELQRSDAGAHPRRVRFHSAAVDMEALDRGATYRELPDSWVIFVTERDLFGLGLGSYPVERVCLATGEPFGDGSHVLYVNAAYRGDDELGSLMRDFCQSDPAQMENELLAERAGWLKRSPKGVAQMCELIEEMRNEARAEALEEGRAEGRAEERESTLARLVALVQAGALGLPEAAAAFGLPEAELRARLS